MSGFETWTSQKARKAHFCDGCGKEICVGERYFRWAGADPGIGEFLVNKLHRDCHKVAELLAVGAGRNSSTHLEMQSMAASASTIEKPERGP